jgi:perosamine synthetase
MKVPFFVPWITADDKKSIIKTLDNRWLTNGPTLKKFEEKFQKFIDCNHASGVGSATQALHLVMRTLNLTSKDEVIVPTFTFAATANAVTYCGAKPILTDVDLETFNISPQSIKKNISKKTKAIVVVHYGGQSCDMNEILAIGKKYNLPVVEDCAHALGSKYGKNFCGSMGVAGCFSFYPTKVITTGEGGMVTTNNLDIQKKVIQLKNQGMDIIATKREETAQWRYDITDVGYNYRLDDIRAALGLSQLNRISEINKRRIKIAKIYDSSIKKIKGLTIPKHNLNKNHIYHLYTIKIEDDYHLTRDELFDKLYKNGIGTSVQYYPLHLMTYNQKNYKNKINNFPNSNKLKDQVLCLPIFPTMTLKQVKYVISKL